MCSYKGTGLVHENGVQHASLPCALFSPSENTLWSIFTQEFLVTLNDLLNCCRIIQSTEVAQTLQVALHNFTQHPSHYLTRAGFWQTLGKL